MAPSCIISEIKRVVKNRNFLYLTCIRRPIRRSNIAITFGTEKLEWWIYHVLKKVDDMFSRFDTIPACNRRMDKKMDSIVCAMHTRCAVKKGQNIISWNLS